ncbi:HalOD1 output domain-containing protein [Halorussus sp. AFM4]|uniref:HalOD1 output domain-containing protein n=1 Tax=Halorussus sp. AFM4 TaxID=3421651 RepID=UPI003EB7C89C
MRTPRTAPGIGRRVSTAIVTAVAEAEGLSPTDLAPPLHDAVDPEALDRLFGGDRHRAEGETRVSFTYYGYDVRVGGPDDVVVRPADESALTGSRSDRDQERDPSGPDRRT